MRCSVTSCAFHPAVTGGKFAAAALTVDLNGVVRNAAREPVAAAERPFERGLWAWVLNDPAGVPLRIAANVDAVAVIAVISQLAANRKSANSVPYTLARGGRYAA